MDRLSDYDYDLPESAIAQVPLVDRASSKLLWIHRATGEISHHTFRDVETIFQSGDLLILNDTRVTALRLVGKRPTGGEVEALLMKELASARYEALVKPAKKLQVGSKVSFPGGLEATVEAVLPAGVRILRFEPLDRLRERLSEFGSIPLPPYITRKLEEAERYQTVYSRNGGSSAAPTAGLHFTPELLDGLRERGIATAFITLDVGIDTFRPVSAENVDEHQMHGERLTIPESTVQAIRNCQGRIIAVGTTTVRALETSSTGRRQVEPGSRISTLFIRPGYQFRVIDGMLTNFHMPKTTMLLMIAALAGKGQIDSAYSEALANGYRFLSFGDSMLIL